jgi:predicted metal-dependent peptidase
MTTQETRLKKAHVALLKNPETSLYSGVILMGKSSVIDDEITAYTDGVNKKYGRKFIDKLSDSELRGLVMHENLHVALKHIHRFMPEFKAEPTLINASADYVVNDIIMNFKAETCKLPQGALYDKQFHNWSVREVYEFLKKEQKQNKDKQSQQGEGQGSGDGVGKPRDLSTLDEHDFENATEMTPEQVAEQAGKIDKALRQGNILAGRMGGKMPRAIEELLEPKIDWRHVLREFVTSTMRGSDEYTWRRFNKRLMANDYYLPSMENEAVGELVVAIDTSGSIGGVELTEFASELASICSVCSPSKVRVLWWDTEVHKEQVFEGDYNNIASLLKPEGGGGTHVSCVNKYLTDNKVNSEAVLVFTDGYVENDIEWTITTPTLWVVTQRRDFVAPSGQVIRKES